MSKSFKWFVVTLVSGCLGVGMGIGAVIGLGAIIPALVFGLVLIVSMEMFFRTVQRGE